MKPLPGMWKKLSQNKSSCVNARGIPTAAYQVLHLLPEVGYPPPPHRPGLMGGGGYPRWGILPAGPPSQVWWGGTWGGVPPSKGTSSQVWQGVSEVGYPPAGYPLAGPGWGTPPSWTWPGYPPKVWTDRHLWKQYLTVVLRTRSVISRKADNTK